MVFGRTKPPGQKPKQYPQLLKDTSAQMRKLRAPCYKFQNAFEATAAHVDMREQMA
jgi:hypothetical protein